MSKKARSNDRPFDFRPTLEVRAIIAHEMQRRKKNRSQTIQAMILEAFTPDSKSKYRTAVEETIKRLRRELDDAG